MYHGGGGNPQGYGSYRIRGNVIYLIDTDGSVEQASVHMRQNDGRITEVMYEGDLYAVQMCQYQ